MPTTIIASSIAHARYGWYAAEGILLVSLGILALYLPTISTVLLTLIWIVLALIVDKSRASHRLTRVRNALLVMLCIILLASRLIDPHQLFNASLQPILLRLAGIPSWLVVICGSVYLWPRARALVRLTQDLEETVFGPGLRLITCAVLVVIGSQLVWTGARAIDQAAWTVRSIGTPPQERAALRKFGVGDAEWFYRVGTFWQQELAHQPGAMIGIPPQGDPWIRSGNAYYVLYFVFPSRVVVQPEVWEDLDPGLTHLVIARGETASGDFGWPKQAIPLDRIKEIVQYDPFRNTTTRLGKRAYDPGEFRDVYGLIELERP